MAGHILSPPYYRRNGSSAPARTGLVIANPDRRDTSLWPKFPQRSRPVEASIRAAEIEALVCLILHSAHVRTSLNTLHYLLQTGLTYPSSSSRPKHYIVAIMRTYFLAIFLWGYLFTGLTSATTYCFFCHKQLGKRKLDAEDVECGKPIICDKGVIHRPCGKPADRYMRYCQGCK
ncbi:hypothetical protein PCANC_14582 [Puccinia coronata f. sp. avenae]|uniref:Uncharacterized protein n=1 Tax=Puccinia coronata f. sp. avenae TaxID=200324 RepID=A0A2N5UGA4_9BASI|nr:hypothetical protein PCANC_14582 [Puccinia coronata f. sp. avenae]